MVFHGSLSDSKSTQASRTLPSILADLNDAVIWLVMNCPLISTSSSPFTYSLGIILSAPITIIIITIIIIIIILGIIIVICIYIAWYHEIVTKGLCVNNHVIFDVSIININI